jgi:membrane-bound acyltransferase YfiQ involved in biofilm formation
MGSGRHVISQLWREHHKKVLAVAVLAWVVFITLAYQKVSARRDDGVVAAILPVGGLPVT